MKHPTPEELAACAAEHPAEACTELGADYVSDSERLPRPVRYRILLGLVVASWALIGAVVAIVSSL